MATANNANDVSSQWSGMAPFIQAAFNLNNSNQAQQASFQQLAQHMGSIGKQQNKGGGANQTPGGMGTGPIQMPSNPLASTTPSLLQASVPGPMTPSAATPQTPLTQAGIPSQVNHFLTGTPNPLGVKSIS